MPAFNYCIECDKPVKILDWRHLCEQCAEKEDENAEKEMHICKDGN